MEIIYGSYILMLAASCVIYFLPMMIAFYRRHENYTAIFLINLLLGWTVVAWVACFVWAFISRKTSYDQNPQASDGNKYDALEKISELKNSGALTPEEFDREKRRILK